MSQYGQAATVGFAARGTKRKSSTLLTRRGHGKTRVGRRIPYGGSRTVTKTKSKDLGPGDYSQMTESRMSMGKYKALTLSNLAKQVRVNDEPTIYRFQGVKTFDDNGYYFCGKSAASGARPVPMYMYDLTSCVNVYGGAATTVAAIPFLRASIADATGVVSWVPQSGVQADGTTASTALQVERAPSSGVGTNYPHLHSRLQWTDVKMNLWGAKTKATKYVIQVVQLQDELLDPLNSGSGNVTLAAGYSESQRFSAFWQSQIKQFTFNPITESVGGKESKQIKVLKTFTKIIQPTSSTENDTDPHCHTLRWFMKWDQDLDYNTRGAFVLGDDLTGQADYANVTNQSWAYVQPKSKIWLYIRAAAYTGEVTETNAISPSFDLVARQCHIAQH